MALTAQAASLTEAHRRNQIAVRARFSVAFASAWRRLLNPGQLDRSAPIWLAVSQDLVSAYAATSAELATGYFRNYRAAELSALDIDAEDLPDAPAPVPDPVRVRTSLVVCGPVAVKQATGRGASLTDAAALGEARAEAAAARHVLNAGRDVIRRNAERDRVAVGWARVTDGSPCWLCAMQASRGPDFKTRGSALLRSDGQVYHDGCNCSVEPVYSRNAPWPPGGRDWRALWDDVAKGKPPDKARKAFRAAVDAQARDRAAAEAEPDTAPSGATGDADRNRPETAPEPTAQTSGTEAEPEPETPASAGGSGSLAGTDLAGLSDDELFALFSDHADDEDALALITAELDRRDDDGPTDAPAPDPLEGIDLAGLGAAWLDKLSADHAGRPDVVARIDAERARRAEAIAAQRQPAPAADPAPVEPDPRDDLTPEQKRVNALVAEGWSWEDAYAEAYGIDPDDLTAAQRTADVDAQRLTGETRADAVRRLYREYVDLQYIAAEEATRGHMLSKQGAAAGIDPVSLFSGPVSRARLYGSEDLLRWFADNGRLTFTAFRAQLLGREADKQAAAVTAAQSNARDFI